MKSKGKRLTSTRIGLYVLALLLFLVAPGVAREGGDTAKPAAVQEWTPDSTIRFGDLTPEQQEALKAATPKKVPVAQATPQPEQPEPKKQPQTVGQVFEQLGGTQKVEPEPAQTEPLPPGQQLHLPDRRPPGDHWASDRTVGKSTFVDKLVRVCWSLAIVAFLVWVSAKVAGKAGLKQLTVGSAGSKSMIEILEKKRLSPGRSVMLMRVGPKVLAVAATESGYETLTEFEGEEFKKFQDSSGLTSAPEEGPDIPEDVRTPADIARHYLSIIPGTGAKK